MIIVTYYSFVGQGVLNRSEGRSRLWFGHTEVRLAYCLAGSLVIFADLKREGERGGEGESERVKSVKKRVARADVPYTGVLGPSLCLQTD